MPPTAQIKLLFLMLASSLLGACAENNYLFRPAQQATAQVSGLPAARYEIPPERPMGEVLVVSTGVTEIKPDNVPQRALFARVIVTNNSDEATWRLDTRKQTAILGGQKVAPTYVNTFGEPLPTLQIPKGEKRTIDFYFPVPAGTETNSDVPQFELAWSIDTGSRVVAQRTTFDRYRVEPVYRGGGPYYAGYYGYGYPYYGGPYGWYDPWWGPRYGIGIHHYHGWGWGGYGGYGGYGGWGYGGGWGGGGWGGGGIGGGGRGGGSYSRPSVR